jgi:hypothetical protein
MSRTYATTVTQGGSGGGFTKLPVTGGIIPNGIRTTFTFSELPDFIVSDHAWYEQTNLIGTTNWSWDGGTLTVTLLIPPPVEDIWGVKN